MTSTVIWFLIYFPCDDQQSDCLAYLPSDWLHGFLLCRFQSVSVWSASTPQGKGRYSRVIYLFCLQHATDQMRDRLPLTNRVVLLKLCLLPKWKWRSESVWCSYGVQFILWPFPGTRLQFNVPWWLFNGFFALPRIKGRCDLSGPWHDASYYQVRQICVKVSSCEGVEVKKNYWDCRYFYFYFFFVVVDQMST